MRKLIAVVFLVGCTGEGVPVGMSQNPITCDDRQQSGNETDVDCGGACQPCGGGKGCLADKDCTSSSCSAHVCCQDGLRDCDGDGNNGCEAHVAADPANCGGCGVACQRGETCEAGACKAPNNCGGGCNLANATSSCVGGECMIDRCDDGFGDCNADAKDGCEADLMSDNANCGACGNACVQLQMCLRAVCIAPQDDCKDRVQDGLETDVDCGGGVCAPCNDGLRCGGDADCQSGSCVNRVCQPAGGCGQGRGDCDRNPANGCETNLFADSNNCGACGNVCPNGKRCQNGICF